MKEVEAIVNGNVYYGMLDNNTIYDIVRVDMMDGDIVCELSQKEWGEVASHFVELGYTVGN